MIVYTSGTTGRPKGAVLSHGNITWNSLNVLTDYDITSTERALMIAPLFHVAALGMGCFTTILKGGSVVLEEKFEPGGRARVDRAVWGDPGQRRADDVPADVRASGLGIDRPVDAAQPDLRRFGGSDPGARRLRAARAVVLTGLRDDRDGAGGNIAPATLFAHEGGIRRARALLHLGAYRRRCRAGNRRRDRGVGTERDSRILEQLPQRPRSYSRRMAGCARAMSATPTSRASSTSPTARKT